MSSPALLIPVELSQVSARIDSEDNPLYDFKNMLLQLRCRFMGFKGSLGLFVVFLAVYLVTLAIVGLHRPAWGDEEHFAQTIRQFGQGITLDLLRTYGEMSTPLPFIAYAVWGKLLGFELLALRVLSLAFALSTAILFWSLF